MSLLMPYLLSPLHVTFTWAETMRFHIYIPSASLRVEYQNYL